MATTDTTKQNKLLSRALESSRIVKDTLGSFSYACNNKRKDADELWVVLKST